MNGLNLQAQLKLVPELRGLLEQRYRLLKIVKMAGPVGRRALSEMTNWTERETRAILDVLRDQHLIQVAKEGTSITDEGAELLITLEGVIEELSGRKSLAEKLKSHFAIQAVRIVSSDEKDERISKQFIAMEVAKQFTKRVQVNDIVAVTGGSTIAAVPEHISSADHSLLFIAARGGVGDEIGLQANVIAAKFAEAFDASYKTLYYPEALSEEAHEVLRKEPDALRMLDLYEQTQCVLHGIGNASEMAAMRNATMHEQEHLLQENAVGEAFGYYFNEDGQVVHRLRTVGIQLEQLEKVPLIIAAAGGEQKARAIIAYLESAPKQTILVTDENAAQAMLHYL